MTRHYRMKDLDRISLDNAIFRERRARRKTLRLEREEEQKARRVERTAELQAILNLGLDGKPRNPVYAAEAVERVKHKACWRARG